MNIIHIIDAYDLSNGIVTVVKDLSNAQRYLGNKVVVLNINKKAIDISGFNNYSSYNQIIRKIIEAKSDIVIFHGLFYFDILILCLKIAKLHIPYLLMPHGAYSKINYSKSKIKKYFFKQIFLKYPVKNSNGWIFLNQSEKNNFTLPNKDNSIIIPNGCNPQELFLPDNNKIKIIFLGRYDIFHKGLDRLVKGIKEYISQSTYNKVEFEFYGNGHEADHLTLQKLCSNIPQIKINNPVYGDEKNRLLQETDIMILTSRLEGFPMSIIEGWSCGIPCIVTKETNIADIVEINNCGWVIPNGDKITIANTIATAIKDYNNLKTTIRSNAFSVACKLNWLNVAKISIKRYKEILSKKRRQIQQ